MGANFSIQLRTSPNSWLVREGNRQRLLPPTQCAEVWHRPIQPSQFQQAFHKPSRLPQGQTEQDFEGQTGLNGSVAVGLLTPPASRRARLPCHLGIKPNRERPSLLERKIVLRPVTGLVLRWFPAAHSSLLLHQIHTVNPRGPDLCNKALQNTSFSL